MRLDDFNVSSIKTAIYCQEFTDEASFSIHIF